MQFIQLCKTLYDMFVDQANEQELYHSIATVATLLLQMGDIGKQFYGSSPGGRTGQDSGISPRNSGSNGNSNDSNSGIHGDGSSGKENISADSVQSVQGSDSAAQGDRSDQSSGTCDKESPEGVSPSGLAEGEEREQKESTETAAGDEGSPKEAASAESQSTSRAASSATSLMDQDWAITFEQFLASLLTEPPLVQFFEKRATLSAAIDHFRNRRLYEKSSSVSDT